MSELAQLEKQLKDARELVDRRELALRLSQNPDFRKLILEDFLVTETVRNVGLSADPALDKDMRADSLSMAQAGGHLKRYLSTTVSLGNIAEGDIQQLEAAITEVRQEGED